MSEDTGICEKRPIKVTSFQMARVSHHFEVNNEPDVVLIYTYIYIYMKREVNGSKEMLKCKKRC